MEMLTEVRPVARKRQHGGDRPGSGRPKSDRDDVSVKVDRTIAAKAQFLAKISGVSLAEYVSEVLKATVDPAFNRAIQGGHELPVD